MEKIKEQCEENLLEATVSKIEVVPVLPDLPDFEEKKKVYSVLEIQEMLGISRTASYELIKRHNFRSVRAGARILVCKKSFDQWLGI